MRKLFIAFGATSTAALLLAGCGGQTPQQAPAEPEPAAVAAPAVMPKVSVNAMMVAMVDHAGHALWDAEREGKAPKTDADWELIEEHAVQLAAAGPAVAAGGTGVSDAIWAQSADWRKDAQAMTDAGMEAMHAAQTKNMEALIAANGKLVDSCEGCHKQFKPELPTEGITHSHMH